MKSALQKGFTTFSLHERGFTIPELLITMGIIAILFGFISINLIHLQRRSYLTTTVDTLVSDFYSQQNKAMVGDTEGRASADYYGVHFEADQYILFHGSSYSPLDATNFNVDLNSALTFSNITFPSQNVIFATGGGGLLGFVSGSDTVTLLDSTNSEQKIIQLNKYGAITIQ